LCRTGRTTGTECGEVSSLGADETESANGVHYQLRNMGELDVCGSADGDSGGPLYKNSRAFGLLSASINVGPAYCFTTYQGIRGAENLLGVSVLLSP
jgi:streptogrisin B